MGVRCYAYSPAGGLSLNETRDSEPVAALGSTWPRGDSTDVE